MIIIKKIGIENYRNIKRARLNDLKDLNILIGPNNCGKTNILELILSLRNLSITKATTADFLCEECKKLKESDKEIENIYFTFRNEDFYLRESPNKVKSTLTILFNRESIDKLVPKVLKKQEERLSKITTTCQHIEDAIIMKSLNSTTLSEIHFSPFIHNDIIGEIKGTILYCPEGRLQSYGGKNFVEYIRERQLRGSQKRRWIDFLNRIVDAKINDERYENLIRRVNGRDLEASILEQGSGVRSLACLAVDILFNDAKIVLIDEPELGLNPFVKQEFLKFLLNESKERQIFIATHDPTFVNPVVWKNKNVRVFFYSLMGDEFLKVDLAESKEDPDTFAGYMPHTTSLKDTHMYLEGASDVYIFQIFLLKHLKYKYEDWIEILNKVGIYHLGGDFWSHLLYTVPNHPYRCLVVLDGDKKQLAEGICKEYEQANLNVSKFKFCKTIEELKNAFSSDVHPVYCLERNCIEEYLEPKPDYKDSGYDKKRDGPKIAEAMGNIPKEIEDIFEIILQNQIL